jgi:LuxR family transcriptional regulator, maltose regulon positive regulatory protein
VITEGKPQKTGAKPGPAAQGISGSIRTRCAQVSWSLSKITPPTAGPAARNARLFRRLEMALNRPIVWVQGPPGAGKTTLVASYLAAQGVDPLWYRLDEDDADPATLFFFLGMADARARGSQTPRLPALTSEYLRGTGAFSRRFFQKLFDSPDRPILVMDDYHEVGLHSSVHSCVAEGLKEVPERAHVLIISRAPPPKEFARLRINGLIDVTPPDLLRLNAAEARAIARARSLTVATPLVDQLIGQTQGWTAGLILMMEAAESGTFVTEGQIAAVPELLFDYFAGEVFQQMEERSQRILMMLAIMPSMTAAAAQVLTCDDTAAELLDQLARRSYFTVRDAEAEPHYRFHPLFREFLLTNARRSFSAIEWIPVLLRAAHALEKSGQPDAAIPLLHEVAAWDDLARIIKDWAQSLVEKGRYTTLRAWLERLPADRIQTDAWLSYWAGKASASFEPAASRMIFGRALDLFDKSNDVTGVFLAWAGRVDAIVQDPFADFTQLDADIALLRELVRRYPSFPNPEIECQVAILALIALRLRRCGGDAEIASWRTRALESAAAVEDPPVLWFVCAYCAFADLINGEFATARDLLDALPPLGAMDRAPVVQGLVYGAVSFAQLCKQAPGRCEDTAEKALKFAETSGIHRGTHLKTGFAALEACQYGELAKGKKWLRRTAELSHLFSRDKDQLYYLAVCYLALLAGDNGGAVQSGRKAVELATINGWRFQEAAAHLALTEALGEAGQHTAADAQLESTEAFVIRFAIGSFPFPIELLRADFLFARGHEDAGRKALQKAMVLGERTGARRTQLMPSRTSRLCARALEHEIEPAYARLLIELGNLLPPDLRVEQWPWPLKIITLGSFSLTKDGEPLVLSRKVPRRLFTLLKAIAAFGGTNITETQLIDAVWPEEEGDAGHRAFDVAVHRLRKLVGDGSLIILKGGRLSLDRKRCWLDVWAFEEGLSSTTDEVALCKTLALYKGAFLLGDEDLPFAEPRRRQLAARFQRATEALAKIYIDAADWNRASATYQDGIKSCPDAEALHQGLMRCRAQLGEPNAVHEAYQQLCASLASSGLKPTEASHTLYHALGAPRK